MEMENEPTRPEMPLLELFAKAYELPTREEYSKELRLRFGKWDFFIERVK